MNLSELNNEFDVLFEDMATAGSKGLDTYEKSLCYTYAQDQLIKGLAVKGDYRDIEHLLDFYSDSSGGSPSIYRTALQYSSVQGALVELNYFLKSLNKDIPAEKVPIAFIDKMLNSAYQYPPKNIAYVVVGEDSKLVFPPLYFNITEFVTRYVKLPTPIILENLAGGLTIREISTATNPILDDRFETELIQAAVQFAIKIYIGQQEKEVSNDTGGN